MIKHRTHILDAHPGPEILSKLPSPQLLTILTIVRMARIVKSVGVGASAWVGLCDGVGAALTGGAAGAEALPVLGHFTRAVVDDWDPPISNSIKYIMADHGEEEGLSPIRPADVQT
jgi:hypothetical protein